MSASEQTSASKREPYTLLEELIRRKKEYHKTLYVDGKLDQFVNGRFWEAQEILQLISKQDQPDELSKAQARIAELEAEVADLKTRSFAKSGEPIPCNDTPSGYFTKDMI